MTAAREGDDVVLRVSDNGMGIDPALLPHVFEMFVQGARGPDRSQGGLGLGLSLVRTLTDLARRHGQRTQRRTWPRQRVHGAAAGVDAVRPPDEYAGARGTAAGQPGHVKRVLVVDDNRDGAEMISRVLSAVGHEVRVANDASQALSLVDSFRPQVAILDIGLPVMDGYTLGRELRARLGAAAPILIALTGYGQDEDKRRSEEAGFALHLVKPVSARTLVDLLADRSSP